MADRGGRFDLERAIAALEAQRTTLGDPVADLALAPLRDALAALATTADALDDDAKRAEATLRLASALMLRGEHDAGAAAARRTLELAESSGTPRFAALAYAQLTTWGRRTNRIGEAREFAERGLTLARRLGDRRVEGTLLNALANACKDSNDYERQRSLTLEALEIARDTGDRVQEVLLLNNTGCARAEFGDLEHAGIDWELALAVTREIEYNYGEAILRVNLAGAANLMAVWAAIARHVHRERLRPLRPRPDGGARGTGS
jgi:tetratricopeptide (TPR) repeat protein